MTLLFYYSLLEKAWTISSYISKVSFAFTIFKSILYELHFSDHIPKSFFSLTAFFKVTITVETSIFILLY